LKRSTVKRELVPEILFDWSRPKKKESRQEKRKRGGCVIGGKRFSHGGFALKKDGKSKKTGSRWFRRAIISTAEKKKRNGKAKSLRSGPVWPKSAGEISFPL